MVPGRPRSKTAVPVWVLTRVALVWAALAAQASYARGLAIGNCGCLGTYASQPLRWWVLVEDTLLLVCAWLLLCGTRNRPSLGPPSDDAPPPARTSSARTEQEKH